MNSILRNATLFVLAVVCVYLTYFVFCAAVGCPVSGQANTTSEIPFVGDMLAELEFQSPASFRAIEHPHGGGTCSLQGTTTRASMQLLITNAELTVADHKNAIQNSDEVLQFLEDHEIEIPEDLLKDEFFAFFGMGGRFRKTYGVYEPGTDRFWIWLQFDGQK